MTESRPAIPKELQRQLLVESGHRCAIPTCRQVPVEFAHIEPWEKLKEHKFENMLCLCPTCHARHHKHEIDKKSLLIYKRNLATLNGRYSSLEVRLLHLFAKKPDASAVTLPSSSEILIMYLIQDGVLEFTGQTSGVFINDEPTDKVYRLTEHGRDLVKNWITATAID